MAVEPIGDLQIFRGPKLDGSLREMWFTIRNGRKVRIGARRAHAMLNAGTAVEVDPTTLAYIFSREQEKGGRK